MHRDGLIDCLRKRGLIEEVSSEKELEKLLEAGPLRLYCGFDPTADSLHLGNLVGIVILRWFQLYGHQPVVILGGATARIGDPSGKTSERPLLSLEEIEKNILKIRTHFETILDYSNEKTKPLILNNYEWMSSFSFIDFLRDVGKHFRLGMMLSKEMVRNRIAPEGDGMSFTEFSYQILQGYDFVHLKEKYGVCLQIGGSDQWGNITAGMELHRKVNASLQEEQREHLFGLTFPLLTRSDGKKFGKSEEGAIWLAKEKLSPFQFYQHLIKIADADVIRLMKALTFMSLEEIESLEAKMQQPDYRANEAQQILASELTKLVHKEEGLAIALKVTEALRPGSLAVLDASIFESLADHVPKKFVKREDLLGAQITQLIASLNLIESRGEAKKLLANGGLYLNNEKISQVDFCIDEKNLIGNRFILIGLGKTKRFVVEITT